MTQPHKRLLEVSDLQVAFKLPGRWIQAVRGASFSLSAGETLGLVGESGSGKSATALAILRLLPPAAAVTGGDIRFDGRSLLQLDAWALRQVRGRRIGMVFQEPMTSLNPVLRCGDQVAEMFRVHQGCDRREARRRAVAALARVRLPDPELQARQYPHQLSGGMRQRVMIAIAIACRPQLLLADEPTTALDMTVQAEILSLVRDLQRDSGMSVLWITHDLAVVASVASRVAVMQAGRIVEQGRVAEVLRRPAHPYTRLLLQSCPDSVRSEPVPRPAAPVLLEVRNLRTEFQTRRGFGKRRTLAAVDGVSLDIRAGEAFGLVGESGSGKTTLARSIVRLVDSCGGSVRFDGQTLVGERRAERRPVPRAIRRQVQIVFQDPFASLNPRLPVGAAIAEVLRVHRVVEAAAVPDRVAELFTLVGLEPARAGEYPHQFSGGQRQRVVIARALAVGPRLLICDEPLAALDVSTQAQILSLLERLRQTAEMTYLFISHDIRVVRQFCDRAAVMHRGRIVEVGEVQKVLQSPRHAYTRALLEACPPAPGRAVQGLTERPPNDPSPFR